MSAVFGEPLDAGTDVVAGSGGVAADTAVEPEPSTTSPAEDIQPQGETDVTKLDLTQPQHLQTFRSSYDKVKFERDEEARLRAEASRELESIRANQGKGVFLDTNLPLEDFKPREALDRMMEEEPEYYERVASDFMNYHFWPDLGQQIKSIEGQPLNPDNPADAVKLESLGTAWDSLARRMSKGQLDGDSLYSVLEILEKSEDLQQVIIARMNGAAGTLPAQPAAPSQSPAKWGQPQGIQSPEAIAARYGLDLSDQDHVQLVQQMQSEQQVRQSEQAQRQRELAQRDLRIQAMQRQIDGLKNDHEDLRGTSSEEAQRRASSRLTELLETSLDTDIQSTYASAVPKDRPGLLGDLKIIAKAALDANPDYKGATARAEKWFKQAASAQNVKDRDRWDKSGLDALAVVSNYRATAIATAAERLLGPIRRTVGKQNDKTKELQRGRREIPGGQATPPITPRQPVEVGNMQATRDAVRERMKDAINRGVPGLPRV